MSFKTRFMEAQLARQDILINQLYACLLERAGHRTAAEMLRTAPQPQPRAAYAAPDPEVNAEAIAARPAGRSWRIIKDWYQRMSATEPLKEQPDGQHEEPL